MVHIISPGTVGRGVLWHSPIAHAGAQVWVHNVNMMYNHAYYATLLNQKIQECDKNYTE